MKRFFKMERLIQPSLNGELQLHNIYVIRDKTTGNEYRVRCTQKNDVIYNLNIIDEKDSPTDGWLQLSKETYCTEFELTDAVSAKRGLDELSKTFTPTSVKF